MPGELNIGSRPLANPRAEHTEVLRDDWRRWFAPVDMLNRVVNEVRPRRLGVEICESLACGWRVVSILSVGGLRSRYAIGRHGNYQKSDGGNEWTMHEKSSVQVPLHRFDLLANDGSATAGSMPIEDRLLREGSFNEMSTLECPY